MDKAYLPEYQDYLPDGLRDKFYFNSDNLFEVVYKFEEDSYHWLDNRHYHRLS